MEYNIESILEMYEDDYNPSSMVPGPRNMYKYAGIVKQGSNKGKHKYTDFYPKKTNGSFHEWFDSKEEMEEALQNRKEESGRGLSQKELTNKYKKYLTAEGFKNWFDADDAAKKRIKQQFRYDQGLGYQKVGRTKINPKTIKLLEKKKPINPKTGLPYTQEEFIKLTPGQKTKLSLRMRDKKKPATWDKRLGYDYGKKDNKLLNYMKEAAKQQEKLPVKDRTFINVYEQDGKKYVGVRDVKANTLYTHVDYDLSKDGAKKGTVITSHPQVANPDSEFNVYRNAAEKFKYDSPDKLLKSYFSKYERVPTYNEIYNFFTMDRSAPTSTMSKHNALTLQHLDVIAKNPTSNFQLLTGLKNTEANKIINQLKRGEITEAKANYDLNKIGAGQEGYGVPKEKMTPGKGMGVAKRDAIKKFKDAYKVNPNVIEDMTKKLNIDLLKLAGTKNKKCKGLLSYGGRVALQEGLSPEFCINEGKKVARDLVAKNIKGSPAQNSIMKRITSGVTNFAKSILDPKELFDLKKQFLSKGALASVPIFDAVMAADDALRKDMDPKEAFAKTLTFGTIPSAAGFTDNVDVLNAKKMLENPSLSPAGKEYAQLIIDSTNLSKGQSDTGIVESFKTLTEGPTNQFKNLQELKDKVSSASTSGRFDYENALAEMQGTFKAKPKENKFFFDDAPDAPDVTPLTNKLATPAKSRGPMTEKKKQKVDLTPTTYENYKPYSFTKEEFEDTMRQVGALKEGQVYNDDFYKEQIETPMKASQFKEYMELPSFRGANEKFSEGGIASLNVNKK